MKTPLRRTAGTAAVLASLVTGALGTGTASAASTAFPDGSIATYNAITRIDASGMGLQGDNGRDAGRVSAFEAASPGLTRTTVNGVLASGTAAIAARPLCHDTNIAGARGFCPSVQDDTTSAWVPQGITGSGESPQAAQLVNGRKVLITSAHAPDDQGERLTFADVTDPAHVTYKHALLVGVSDDSKNFAQLTGHANSVVWSGSRLYVAAIGSGFDVFDLNDIWQMDTTSDTAVGRDTAGRTHGAGFTYVLPRTGSYAYTGAGSGCGSYAGVPDRPCITAASLDTSGDTPALVTAEGDGNSTEGNFGRATAPVVRWPIDLTTGRLRADASGHVTASEAYASPMGGVQGVAMNKGRFVLAGACPEWVAAEHQTKPVVEFDSCLYEARADEPVHLVTRTAVNLQNFSYWPGTDQLWMVNEYGGGRIVANAPWPDASPVPAGIIRTTSADFTGDARADLVGVEAATGKLWLYPGNGNGTFGDRIQIGTGWGAMDKLAAADYTGDGKADLLTVDTATGTLYAYAGTGTANGMNTLGARTRIGTGWNDMRELTALDADADGHTDLAAIDRAGTLWVYPGTGTPNGTGTLGNRTRIGSSWNTMTELTSTTGHDLLALDSTGALWSYPATGGINGTSTLGARTRIGTGWDSMRQLTGADFDGDGTGDVDAVQAPAGATGPLYFYPGTGPVGLGERTQIGVGW
ncbi:VCBS repeat-containing protein [Streptomyces sp. NBC_00083]|uniref:FG-GAP repeat domain-containing protein n=1 Tax=Streptomyces sp. NBC_00083 TaxID=2975647 RepID=UPI0022583A60|nr:VCBS repeat-containing protein [Streptomyces sp. NBC_00083]MCX5382584.1 VCBS repeat-containing protein [Streptomyces sp. NBC_00083]